MPHYIAMWSGPRNISTALMRSFENRSDCYVSDEPFYPYFLYNTGISHPMRREIIEKGEVNCKKVIDSLTGPIPHSKQIWYQKHMAHHILIEMDLEWILKTTNCLLIRHPLDVIISYLKRNEIKSIDQLGSKQLVHIYKILAEDTNSNPIIIDAGELLLNPKAMLVKLCNLLKIKFEISMLLWPKGSRDTDGIWGKHWYKNVENSTGFRELAKTNQKIPSKYEEIYIECLEYYKFLYQNRITLDS